MGSHRQGPINEALQLIQREWSWEVGNIDPIMAISSVREQKCQIQMSTCHFGRRFDTKQYIWFRKKKKNAVWENSACQWNLTAVKVPAHPNFQGLFSFALAVLIVLPSDVFLFMRLACAVDSYNLWTVFRHQDCRAQGLISWPSLWPFGP